MTEESNETVPHDNCNHCQQDYDLTVENAHLQLFLREPEYTFILAHCPHCDTWTRMFIGLDTACALVSKLPIYVDVVAPDVIKASHKKLFGTQETPEVAEAVEVLTELPDLPPDLRRQLYDWLRESDHGF